MFNVEKLISSMGHTWFPHTKTDCIELISVVDRSILNNEYLASLLFTRVCYACNFLRKLKKCSQ